MDVGLQCNTIYKFDQTTRLLTIFCRGNKNPCKRLRIRNQLESFTSPESEISLIFSMWFYFETFVQLNQRIVSFWKENSFIFPFSKCKKLLYSNLILKFLRSLVWEFRKYVSMSQRLMNRVTRWNRFPSPGVQLSENQLWQFDRVGSPKPNTISIFYLPISRNLRRKET